jgi:hypothetical protein
VIEWFGSARTTLRLLGRVPLLLRAVVLTSCVVAMAATIVPSWDVPNGYMVVALVAAVVATIAPDSGGGFVFAAAIVVGWATGSEAATIGPAVVIAALALLAGHVAGALAAAMLAAATVATAALVAGFERWRPPGSIVIVLAALATTGAGVWWWSTVDDDA